MSITGKIGNGTIFCEKLFSMIGIFSLAIGSNFPWRKVGKAICTFGDTSESDPENLWKRHLREANS